jgi:hypothetical protein
VKPALSLFFILIASCVYAQSWDDMAHAKPVNFDKLLVGTDKMIYIQPPEGKYWIIVQASFQIEEARPELWVAVWLDHAPFAPYRDPITGEMYGCFRCVDLIRTTASYTFLPIVGGYAQIRGLPRLQGQSLPIVLRYPDRLNISVTPVHGGLDTPLQTYTRLMVIERFHP